MAFSFTPGQIAQQGNPAAQAPVAGASGGAGIAPVPVAGPPSDSPFLFIRERGQPLSVMACVQIVLIVATALFVFICGTMYAYSIYLNSQIEAKKVILNDSEKDFPEYNYDDMRSLSERMKFINRLLSDYVSVRSPLKFLEDVVEQQVVFEKFLLSKDKTGSYLVSFVAVTGNYRNLIQQLDSLNLTEYKKIAPSPKSGNLQDDPMVIKIQVTTPVIVQGKLPDEIIFLAASSTKSQLNATSSSSGTEIAPNQ